MTDDEKSIEAVNIDTYRLMTMRSRRLYHEAVKQQQQQTVQNLINETRTKINFYKQKHNVKATNYQTKIKKTLLSGEPIIFGTSLLNMHYDCEDCNQLQNHLKSLEVYSTRKKSLARTTIAKKTVRKCPFCDSTFKNFGAKSHHINKFHNEEDKLRRL